ncbi:MAG: M4 family metallopeptidase [Candidatus Melainabacteria bacterium]|nr:M4 family metallopeptidase [Candidatus Melainabacteria bacterium]
MTHNRNFDGFIPAFLLNRWARLNPTNLSLLATLAKTQALALDSQTTLPAALRFAVLAAGQGDRRIFDCMESTRLPGTRARHEGDGEYAAFPLVNDAYEFHGDVRRFLTEVCKRNSLDNKGMDLIGSVNYDRGYNNAYFNQRQMVYGNGDQVIFARFIIRSIVGHEMFHGVTHNTSGLEYQGQSGALNESFSDVGGVLVDQFIGNIKASKADWLVGPGLFMPSVNGKALRSMIDPGSAYDDDKLGKDPQPDHMDRIFTGWEDNGGVHINSGIVNKAFALFAIAMDGYAFERPFAIWYAANCGEDRVGANATFQDFADKTMVHCAKIAPRQKNNLKDAWQQVGITVAA